MKTKIHNILNAVNSISHYFPEDKTDISPPVAIYNIYDVISEDGRTKRRRGKKQGVQEGEKKGMCFPSLYLNIFRIIIQNLYMAH